MRDFVFIGYSGHSFVCMDTAFTLGYTILGYCDVEIKEINPFKIDYLGSEADCFKTKRTENVFISIGNNYLREKIYHKFNTLNFKNLIHPSSIISSNAKLKNDTSSFISSNVSVNALANIGKCVILNTSCVIEHECDIADFVHIAPGAVLAGNVKVGKRTFVGANSVIKQGVTIGEDVTIGAGSVVIKNVPNGVTVVGNPGKILNL